MVSLFANPTNALWRSIKDHDAPKAHDPSRLREVTGPDQVSPQSGTTTRPSNGGGNCRFDLGVSSYFFETGSNLSPSRESEGTLGIEIKRCQRRRAVRPYITATRVLFRSPRQSLALGGTGTSTMFALSCSSQDHTLCTREP